MKFYTETGQFLVNDSVVTDLTARDAIPAIRRIEGMRCRVASQGVTYQLVGGTENANWSEVGSRTIPVDEEYFGFATVVRYVNGSTGSDNNNGKTTNAAFQTLQRAFDDVPEKYNGEVIIKCEGNLADTVATFKARSLEFPIVKIVGGFLTTGAAAVTSGGSTLVSGKTNVYSQSATWATPYQDSTDFVFKHVSGAGYHNITAYPMVDGSSNAGTCKTLGNPFGCTDIGRPNVTLNSCTSIRNLGGADMRIMGFHLPANIELYDISVQACSFAGNAYLVVGGGSWNPDTFVTACKARSGTIYRSSHQSLGAVAGATERAYCQGMAFENMAVQVIGSACRTGSVTVEGAPRVTCGLDTLDGASAFVFKGTGNGSDSKVNFAGKIGGSLAVSSFGSFSAASGAVGGALTLSGLDSVNLASGFTTGSNVSISDCGIVSVASALGTKDVSAYRCSSVTLETGATCGDLLVRDSIFAQVNGNCSTVDLNSVQRVALSGNISGGNEALSLSSIDGGAITGGTLTGTAVFTATASIDISAGFTITANSALPAIHLTKRSGAVGLSAATVTNAGAGGEVLLGAQTAIALASLPANDFAEADGHGNFAT